MYKIYKIVDNTNNNVYIGQTKQKYLSSRISTHKNHFKKSINDCSSNIILKNNDWYYQLIEETEDKSREAYWIENSENCINKKSMKYGRGGINTERRNKYDKERYEWENSWGGGYKYNAHNNLLWIDINLFK